MLGLMEIESTDGKIQEYLINPLEVVFIDPATRTIITTARIKDSSGDVINQKFILTEKSFRQFPRAL